MKKFIALLLIISFFELHCAKYEMGEGINLEPGQKPGVKLVIKKIDSQLLRGELIAVKHDSLLLKESESGADVSVDIPDIRTITILKESKVLAGVGAGFLGGGLAGIFAGTITGGATGEEYAFGPSAATIGAAYGFAIGAVAGALIGGNLSAKAGKDKTIRIEGKSEEELKKILEDLHKKARVPDFQ